MKLRVVRRHYHYTDEVYFVIEQQWFGLWWECSHPLAHVWVEAFHSEPQQRFFATAEEAENVAREIHRLSLIDRTPIVVSRIP
jgi:hypothetical protein